MPTCPERQYSLPGASPSSERGCVADQPQQAGSSKPAIVLDDAGTPYVLRLVLRTQPRSYCKSSPRGVRAFSLIEVMVVVALLSVIIIGLVAMFNQTQRALVSGTTQVDVLESGRAAAELIAREMQQMAPAQNGGVNFYTDTSYSPDPPPSPISPLPFRFATLDPNEFRTNVFEQVYFLSRYNQQWKGIGYFIETYDVPTNGTTPYVETRHMGVGTLYRYETNADSTYPAASVSNLFGYYARRLYTPSGGPNRSLLTNPPITRIIDGVVHFRVRAFNNQGRVIDSNNPAKTRTTSFVPIFESPVVDYGAGDYYYYFTSNTVPAYLEVEVGVLEGRALERFKAITNNPSAAYNYLSGLGGKVHIFRQRVPISNVDPAAYP